jgi:type II secretory pathway component PulJ
MVAFRQRARSRAQAYHRGGFAFTELMISTAIFSAVSAGLLLGFVSLKRSYAATTDFAINHADQMRISDYLALDFRRAVAVSAVKNDAAIYISCYYDSTPTRSPQTPILDGNGGVYYGAQGCSVKVRYYLSGSTIFRKEGEDPAVGLAIDVQDFEFNATDLGKVVKTSITFKPTFRSSGATEGVKAATAFYNTTLLRNNRTDTNTGVY